MEFQFFFQKIFGFVPPEKLRNKWERPGASDQCSAIYKDTGDLSTELEENNLFWYKNDKPFNPKLPVTCYICEAKLTETDFTGDDMQCEHFLPFLEAQLFWCLYLAAIKTAIKPEYNDDFKSICKREYGPVCRTCNCNPFKWAYAILQYNDNSTWKLNETTLNQIAGTGTAPAKNRDGREPPPILNLVERRARLRSVFTPILNAVNAEMAGKNQTQILDLLLFRYFFYIDEPCFNKLMTVFTKGEDLDKLKKIRIDSIKFVKEALEEIKEFGRSAMNWIKKKTNKIIKIRKDIVETTTAQEAEEGQDTGEGSIAARIAANRRALRLGALEKEIIQSKVKLQEEVVKQEEFLEKKRKYDIVLDEFRKNYPKDVDPEKDPLLPDSDERKTFEKEYANYMESQGLLNNMLQEGGGKFKQKGGGKLVELVELASLNLLVDRDDSRAIEIVVEYRIFVLVMLVGFLDDIIAQSKKRVWLHPKYIINVNNALREKANKKMKEVAKETMKAPSFTKAFLTTFYGRLYHTSEEILLLPDGKLKEGGVEEKKEQEVLIETKVSEEPGDKGARTTQGDVFQLGFEYFMAPIQGNSVRLRTKIKDRLKDIPVFPERTLTKNQIILEWFEKVNEVDGKDEEPVFFNIPEEIAIIQGMVKDNEMQTFVRQPLPVASMSSTGRGKHQHLSPFPPRLRQEDYPRPYLIGSFPLSNISPRQRPTQEMTPRTAKKDDSKSTPNTLARQSLEREVAPIRSTYSPSRDIQRKQQKRLTGEVRTRDQRSIQKDSGNLADKKGAKPSDSTSSDEWMGRSTDSTGSRTFLPSLASASTISMRKGGTRRRRKKTKRKRRRKKKTRRKKKRRKRTKRRRRKRKKTRRRR